MRRLSHPLFAAALLCTAGAAPANESIYPESYQPPPQQPVYKCGGNMYTHVPCDGAVPFGTRRVSRTFDAPATQDRARQMNRAQLTAEERQKCDALEASIQRAEARQRARGAAVTEAEQGDLAIQRVHYREMRC